MKVNRRLRRAGCAGGESKKRDVITSRSHGGEVDLLVESDTVELGVVVGGAVETDDAFEKMAPLGAGHQFVEDAGVAQREIDFRLVDNLCQFSSPQHRHGVDHDGACLCGREPAGDHRGIFRRADQHPVAGLHAVILAERAGEPVTPVSKFLVGAAPSMADQRCAVAKAALDHAIRQFDRGVQIFGIVKPFEPKVRPLVWRRERLSRPNVSR